MPGGWTLSMTWMRMPGWTWLGTGAVFMGMWLVMMVAMMLPSLVVVLLGYRRAVCRLNQAQLGGLTVLAGAAYFLVWAVFGAAAYPVGVSLAAAELRWPALARSVPVLTGLALLVAGCLQLTAWKARQLERCREATGCREPPALDARGACQHGLRYGVHCSLCCSGFMTVLLAAGMMDLGAIAIVAVAITAERLAPRPEWTARAAGAVVVATGALVIARALTPWFP